MLAAACAGGGNVSFAEGFDAPFGPRQLPPGWVACEEGEGARPAAWGRVPGPGGGALVLLRNPNFGPAASLLVREGECAPPYELSVRVRALDGRSARGGGLVFGLRAAQDYLAFEWDPLARELRLVERSPERLRVLARGRWAGAAGGWHRLALAVRAGEVVARIDRGPSLRARPERALRGECGLRVPGDARTAFDDFRLAVPRPR